MSLIETLLEEIRVPTRPAVRIKFLPIVVQLHRDLRIARGKVIAGDSAEGHVV